MVHLYIQVSSVPSVSPQNSVTSKNVQNFPVREVAATIKLKAIPKILPYLYKFSRFTRRPANIQLDIVATA